MAAHWGSNSSSSAILKVCVDVLMGAKAEIGVACEASSLLPTGSVSVMKLSWWWWL